MKYFILCLAIGATTLLSSCATSDPMEGGIFFDKNAAYGRLDAKEAELNRIERENYNMRSSM